MDENKFLETVNWIKEHIESVERGLNRLEIKIDNIDKEHDETRERQIKLEKDFEYLIKDQARFIEKYEKEKLHDKDLVYTKIRENEEKSEKIAKLAASVAVKDIKIWIYAGIVFMFISFITIISKMK